MSVMIAVDNLSKQYRIGLKQEQARTLGEAIGSFVAAPLRNLRGLKGLTQFGEEAADDVLWALKNVSFEVKEGEVVGIIGRNGAGKSTLLKVLSRITPPSYGRVVIRGRVSSLLEVGTGFHPELTGRENIYLNGTLLGMRRGEVARKFDEIVDFSGVEKFIDTPVKRYSSGMTVRLAFAVAAHLEPEVLMIDEVLAVGDLAFQKKSIGKMQEVAKSGRTVLFVSHNMPAVRKLCERAVLLEQGSTTAIGTVDEVVDRYIKAGDLRDSVRRWGRDQDAPGNEHVRLLTVEATSGNGSVIDIDSGVSIRVEFDCHREGINLDCTIYVLTQDDFILFESGCLVTTNSDSRVGRYLVRGILPGHILNTGSYRVNLLFGENQRYPLFRLDNAVSFEVENTATGRGTNMSVAPGVMRPLIDWVAEYRGGE